MNRHFFRCNVCLEPYAMDGEKPFPLAVCPWCDTEGKHEYMGVVRQDKVVRTEEKCPCDERCTNAKGPLCDCRCNGKNHGTQRLITVIVSSEEIPKIVCNEKTKGKALIKAAEYKEALQRLAPSVAKVKALADTYKGNWYAARGWLKAYRHAKGMLVHSSRIKALNAIKDFS